jgi:hypothetical protein
VPYTINLNKDQKYNCRSDVLNDTHVEQLREWAQLTTTGINAQLWDADAQFYRDRDLLHFPANAANANSNSNIGGLDSDLDSDPNTHRVRGSNRHWLPMSIGGLWPLFAQAQEAGDDYGTYPFPDNQKQQLLAHLLQPGHSAQPMPLVCTSDRWLLPNSPCVRETERTESDSEGDSEFGNGGVGDGDSYSYNYNYSDGSGNISNNTEHVSLSISKSAGAAGTEAVVSAQNSSADILEAADTYANVLSVSGRRASVGGGVGVGGDVGARIEAEIELEDAEAELEVADAATRFVQEWFDGLPVRQEKADTGAGDPTRIVFLLDNYMAWYGLKVI